MTQMTLHIDKLKRRAEIVYRDELNAESVIQAFMALTDHADWRPEYKRLYVWGPEARMGAFRPDDRARFSRFRRSLSPEKMRALCTRTAHVCPDPIKRSHLHFWIELAANPAGQIRVFSDRQQAEAWLEAEKEDQLQLSA